MRVRKTGAVYITGNKRGNVLYVGVTSDLQTRIRQHKNKSYVNSFSARYNCDVLLWFEIHDTIAEAIVREKQLKAGSRSQKEELIKMMNPSCRDLWEDLQHW
jgi:putative endonuclease